MKTAKLFFLLPLAACASLDIDGARVGVGAVHQRAANTIDLGEFGSVTEKASGDGALARIELTNRLEPGLEVGLEISGAEINLEDVTLDTIGVGGVVRKFFADDEAVLRPYAGARMGYAAGWADVPGFGTGDRVDLFTGGAFLGLDLRLGERVSLFAEGGYEGSIAHDFNQHGAAGMVGLSVRF